MFGEFQHQHCFGRNGRNLFLGVCLTLPTTSEGIVGVTESWKGLPVGAFKMAV